ncbi:IS1595 family transposase ISCco3 [subsurface metagenome]
MLKINKKYKNILSRHTFIDLFSGIGAFRIALESFGAKCVFSSEIDKHCKFVYKMNFGETPEDNIIKIKVQNIPKHTILCAGFPCQAFSISGKQRGFKDTRGTLFFDIVRIAEYHKPKIIFLENVKNFERHDKGNTLKIIKYALNDIGYDVFHKVLNASLFGVPQKRERIYILGFRKDLKIKNFTFPLPIKKYIKLKDVLLPDSKTKNYIINRKDISFKKEIAIKIDLYGNYPLKPIRVGTVNKGGQGERIYHECGHAITLSAYGGGIGAKTGLYLINGKVRKLAPRECAIIMGFPNTFKINPSDSQAFKQFGNSIVIDVLQAIILKIIKKGILNE